MHAQALTGACGAAPSMAAVASATAMSAVYAVVGGAMLLYLAGPTAAAGLGAAFAPPAVAAGACAASCVDFPPRLRSYLPGVSCTPAAFRGGNAQEHGRGSRTGGGLVTVALAPLGEGCPICGRLPRLGRPAMVCCCRMGAAMGAGMVAAMGPCLPATGICCCGCTTCAQ